MTTAAVGCGVCEESPGWKRVTEGDGSSRLTRCDCWIDARPTAAEGVPLEFRTARLQTFKERPGNREARKAADAWLKAETGDLYLSGGTGTGKTRLACSLLNEIFHRTRTGLFVRVPKLLLDLQLGFRADADDASRESEAAYLERLYAVPVLVLDDVGVEKGSDFTRRTLQTLYDERGDRGHRTIWTSNLDLEQLAGFLDDDRLSSRIAGRASIVALGGDDWRTKERWQP